MIGYLIRRILRSLVVLLLFMVVMFYFIQLFMLGDFASFAAFGRGPAAAAEVREQLGLNLPIWQYLLRWFGNALTGNLDSMMYGGIEGILIYSSLVFGIGTVISFQLGEWLGRATSWRKARRIAGAATIIAIVLYTSFPPFLAFFISLLFARRIAPMFGWRGFNLHREIWFSEDLGPAWPATTVALYMQLSLLAVAILLALVNRLLQRRFRRKLPAPVTILLLVGIWLGGWFAIGAGPRVLDILSWVIRPIIIYVLLSFGETMLITQTSMRDVLNEEYIFAARAKGLPERVVRDKHAARNARLPVLSRMIINLPYLLTGMVMIEFAVDFEGMGTFLFNGVRYQNATVVMIALFVIGLIAMIARLSLDISIASLDPRIRMKGLSFSDVRPLPERLGNNSLLSFLQGLSIWRRPPQQERSAAATRAREVEPVPMSEIMTHQRRLLWQRLRAFGRLAKDSWQAFAENRLAVFGVVLILVFVVMAAAHPVLMATVWTRTIYDPMVGHDSETLMHPSGPGPRHLLGTDTLGRDIFSMLLAATRPTIIVALTGGVVAVIVGTLIGAVSAYYQGGIFDIVFGYVADVFLAVPPPILMVIISTRWFEVIDPFKFGLIYGVMAGASSVAVVMRSQGLKMMTQPFIEASRVAGAGDRRVILVHLIPHMLPLAIVQMMLTAIGAIIADGFIAFMGVVDFRLNWGTMVYLGLSFFMVNARVPWPQLLSPVVALSLFATPEPLSSALVTTRVSPGAEADAMAVGSSVAVKSVVGGGGDSIAATGMGDAVSGLHPARVPIIRTRERNNCPRLTIFFFLLHSR